MGHCCKWEVWKVGYRDKFNSYPYSNDKSLLIKNDSERRSLNMFGCIKIEYS